MAQEITTTRAGNGNMTTSTPGAPANPNADLFAALIKQRLAQAAMAQPKATRGSEPAYEAPRQAAYSSPELGTQQSAPIAPKITGPAPGTTRMRRVQIRTPLPSIMEGKGLTYDEVPEELLADGSWSRDAVNGTVAGNEAAARQRMDAIDHPFGGGGGGGDRGGERPGSRTALPFDPRNRNNDARGPGFGMDYGR